MDERSSTANRRLFILAEEAPALLPRFFELVLDRVPPGTEIVGAALEPNLPPPHAGVRHHLRMAGWRRWPNLVHYRLQESLERQPHSVAGVLKAHGIEVEHITSPNDVGFVERLRSLRPHVAFNAGARFLKAPVLSVPKTGWMNRHAGRLPDYRGVAPVWWALFNREPTVTVTYHTMVDAVDGGRVLWEHEESVKAADTVVQLYRRLFDAAAFGFWDALDTMDQGEGRTVDVSSGAYYKLPTATQRREFHRKGLRYV